MNNASSNFNYLEETSPDIVYDPGPRFRHPEFQKKLIDFLLKPSNSRFAPDLDDISKYGLTFRLIMYGTSQSGEESRIYATRYFLKNGDFMDLHFKYKKNEEIIILEDWKDVITRKELDEFEQDESKYLEI